MHIALVYAILEFFPCFQVSQDFSVGSHLHFIPMFFFDTWWYMLQPDFKGAFFDSNQTSHGGGGVMVWFWIWLKKTWSASGKATKCKQCRWYNCRQCRWYNCSFASPHEPLFDNTLANKWMHMLAIVNMMKNYVWIAKKYK